MKQQNIFDKNLSEKLSQGELDFDPIAWEMMEVRLDDEDKRKAPLFTLKSVRRLMLLLLLITCGIATKYLWNSEQDLTSDLETNLRQESNSEIQKGVDTTEKKLSPNNSSLNSDKKNSAIEPRQKIETSISSTNTVTTSQYKRTEKREENRNDSYVQTGHQGQNRQTMMTAPTQSAPTQSAPSSTVSDESDTSNSNKATSKTSLYNRNAPAIQKTETLDVNNRVNLSETNLLGHRDQFLSWNRSIIVYEHNQIDVVVEEPLIERPTHQLNISIGTGMGVLDIEAPFKGDLLPVATQKRDQFLAASYLNRMIHPRIGLEIGAQVGSQTNRISKYVLTNDNFISEPAYGSVSVASTAGEIELDLFANVHYYLPIGRRTELDFYAGYYAANPFESPGGWGSGNGSFVNGTSTRFLASDVSGDSGPFEGGKIKIGMNFNLLTNKINTVSFGISYMHEVVKDVEGVYTFFETTDNANTIGNLSTNGSGIKVQLNYSFGLGKQIKELRNRNMVKQNKWYLAARYGTKNYLFKDDLSRNLISVNPQHSTSILVGHYINTRWSLEMGIEQYQLVFSTPIDITETPSSFKLDKLFMLSIPMAVRYDAIQSKALTVYGKGIFSNDIRTSLTSSDFLGAYSSGFLTDEDRLLLNAGLEIGAEYKLFRGLHLGIHGKYNQPFKDAARYQYPKIDTQGEYSLEDIVHRNQYFGLGVELKYIFN